MQQTSARLLRAGVSGQSYYEWKVPDKAILIQMRYAVIDLLAKEIMEGFWSVPKRGAEVGGVLFGSFAAADGTTTVCVDDYEPVPCEHRRGPSYVLSETDREGFERAIRRGRGKRHAVGFYRSHTRPGLYLDQDDYSVIRSCFAEPHNVFLLVRPHTNQPGVAGFFFWEGGAMHGDSSYREFPLSSVDILNRQETETPEPDLVRAAAPPPAAQPAPAPAAPLPGIRAPAPLSFEPQRLFTQFRDWAGWTTHRQSVAEIAAIAVFLGFAGYHVTRPSTRRAPVAVASARVLHVQQDGKFLRLEWNGAGRSAPGAEGVLMITDGANRKTLRLDAEQLRSGALAYSPASDDVTFRLQLSGGRTGFAESLRVVDMAARARAAAAPIRRPNGAAKTRPEAAAALRPPPAPPAPPRQAREPRRPAFIDDGL